MQNTQNTDDIADPVKMAGDFVASKLSTFQLFSIQDWLNSLPVDGTPKLQELHQWTRKVMALAMQGNVAFPNPTVTFLEVAQECLPHL